MEAAGVEMGSVGVWDQSGWVKPVGQAVEVKQWFWRGEGKSAVTGEGVSLAYYQQATVPAGAGEVERGVKSAQAFRRLREKVEEAGAGWGYIPAFSRLGMVEWAVTEVFEEEGVEPTLERVLEAIRRAEDEYRGKAEAARRLGWDGRQGAFGWRVPIEPMVPVGGRGA